MQAILSAHLPGHEVRAFGSRVRGTAKPYSDLDLAVLGTEPLSLDALSAVREAFAESPLPWKVDVIDWATASEGFRRAVQADWVLVQAGGQGEERVGHQRR